MKEAVQVILLNEKGEVLGVSRKDNHNDMGLCGGKREINDLTLEACGIRETKEETGLDVYDLELIHGGEEWYGCFQYTYIAKYKGDIQTDEPHVVKWCSWDELIAGTFGEYNQMIYNKLNKN